MKKLLLVLALALTPALALAQQEEPARVVAQHPHGIQPVPAPSTAYANANGVAESEHEEGPKPFVMWGGKLLNNDRPPYWAMLFNFAVLLLIYWRFGRKPVAEGLHNRKLAIATAIENAQKILREAKQRSKRYRSKLEKVAADADEARAGKITTGQGEAEMLVRAAEEKAIRIARDAEFLLEQEKKQTHADLLRETVEKAAKEAEDLLRKNVSVQDQERLAEDFIAQLAKDYENGLPGAGSAGGGTARASSGGAA